MWAAVADLGNRRYTMYALFRLRACATARPQHLTRGAGLQRGNLCLLTLSNVSRALFLCSHITRANLKRTQI
jgi:hypothetical protein